MGTLLMLNGRLKWLENKLPSKVTMENIWQDAITVGKVEQHTKIVPLFMLVIYMAILGLCGHPLRLGIINGLSKQTMDNSLPAAIIV